MKRHDWLRRLLADAKLSERGKVICFAVAQFYNDRLGRAWPSIKTLASAAGMAERTVQRALRDAESAGWIVVEQRPGTSPSYTFGGDRFDTPSADHGVTLWTEGGDRSDTPGVTALTRGGDSSDTLTFYEPMKEPRKEHESAVVAPIATEFDVPTIDLERAKWSWGDRWPAHDLLTNQGGRTLDITRGNVLAHADLLLNGRPLSRDRAMAMEPKIPPAVLDRLSGQLFNGELYGDDLAAALAQSGLEPADASDAAARAG